MRFTKSTALVFAAALMTISTAAFATENTATCTAADRQVTTALNSNGPNADEARAEQKRAMEFCNAGLYHNGMVHYAKALELLGAKS
ncbi:MAG: hypothetical protein WDM89_00490 [Rhizomicrobium sp.]